MIALSRSVSRYVMLVALFVAATAAAACLWIAWCEFPVYAWNDVRLTPAFALCEGINPYPLIGEGPVFTWIYGPVGLFVNLPATLASSPLQALRIASGINALIVLGPLAFIILSSSELRARGWLPCALAFALGILFTPWPNLILQVPDHTAIACGLLSLWCLARRPEPNDARLAWVAALTSLAIWSKQIAIFLVVAQLTFFVMRGQRSLAWKYAICVSLFNLVVLVLFASIFGLSNLWLNLVEIPGRLGWADFLPRIKLRLGPIVWQILLPSLALLALWAAKRWPRRDSETIRFFQLGSLAYAAMLPIGLIALFKVGGDTNLLHSWDYLMPAALLWWLSTDLLPNKTIALTLAITAAALTARSDMWVFPKRPHVDHFIVAANLTAHYGNTIWFPQNPLITYFATGQLWHSEDGVSTRFLAGYGIKKADLKRHLPANLQAIAYPSVNTAPFSLPLLSELSQKNRIPYWVFYTRPAPPPDRREPAADVPTKQQ